MQNLRNNISKDLHDDIGASLSNINILNELTRRNIGQPEKSKEYLAKASEDIQRISESLSDIVWNINPKYDDPENLFIRMKRYVADMLDGKNINGEFDFPDNAAKFTLSMTRRRDLYLIFKEAVNNLIKYSGASNAVIKVSVTEQHISLLIKDDGKGFDRSTVRMGNGLQNMEQRAKAAGGVLSVHSIPGKGTTVELVMKVG
jgi:signal transduction histidine kinase